MNQCKITKNLSQNVVHSDSDLILHNSSVLIDKEPEKVATHTMLVFAAMNLKKLATWLWKGKEPLFFCSKIRNEVDKKLFQARVTSLEQLLSTVCDVGDISFSIRNQLRFKRSLPVSGNINVYFTKARFKRLIAITVSSIVMFLWLFRMGVIP
ncbi:hypothetical protein JFK41_13590 [Enterococcus faecium]|nr:hypothetical protein [Enterococcus faecium]